MLNPQKGLTLIELMLCVSLFIIVTAYSLSSYFQILQKKQLETMVDELKNRLRYARNMAFAKGVALTLSPYPNEADWSQGMILFVDKGAHHYQQGDELLYQWQAMHANIHIDWHGFQANSYLLFSPMLQQSSLNGRFTLHNNMATREIVVNRLGNCHVR